MDDANEHARKILHGEQLNKLLSKDGKKLTDSCLVDSFAAARGALWVKNVYRETSGFVHLSAKHVFFAFSIEDGNERSFKLKVAAEREIPDSELSEAVEGMIEISRCILEQLESWITTKNL